MLEDKAAKSRLKRTLRSRWEVMSESNWAHMIVFPSILTFILVMLIEEKG